MFLGLDDCWKIKIKKMSKDDDFLRRRQNL